MNSKTMTYLALGTVVLVVGYFAWKLTSRSAYEAAQYSVETSDGDFQIREYPSIILVATKTNLEKQGRDGSFGRLFNYISGANEQSQKVSMTVPVFMDAEADSKSGTMGFVVPQTVAQQGAPKPTGDEVELKTRQGGRFAVVRFAGSLDRPSQDAARKRLIEWMALKSLTAEAEAVEFAGYDPPWTPGFLRRNEVLIRIQTADQDDSE
ncbi:MAG: heme-binding protein [Fuerstiella sp.]